MSDPLTRIRRATRELRADLVPDPRVDVLEIRTRQGESGPLVEGVTTVPTAEAALRRRLAGLGLDAEIRMELLPDPTLAATTEALVRAPVAPVYSRASMNSIQLTQYVLGTRLTLLSEHGPFLRVRGEDAHVGWVHKGYLATGEPAWALSWERGEQGEPVVSLGADVEDENDQVFARLPWGARVIQQAGGRILLPDGRVGRIGSGEVVPVDRLWDRFPARGESVVRTARRWMGAPYLWGGVTPHGVDCSGLVQSVFWIHGVALPRDSDMQAEVGAQVDPGDGFQRLRAGDLLFFAERGRVNHVALSAGGPGIIHAAASNGMVGLNNMAGDGPPEANLRETFHLARRLLPD